MSIVDVFARREAVTKRIVEHCTLDSKERAISLVTAFMSLDDLEEIAKFWDDRLSPEEMKAIAAEVNRRNNLSGHEPGCWTLHEKGDDVSCTCGRPSSIVGKL
jgi:uncharacterized protein YerC